MAGDNTDPILWAADIAGWDQENGAPGIGLFGNAIQVWAIFQGPHHTVSVAEAAKAFNCDPQRIIQAVNDHSYMYLCGDSAKPLEQTIEHDGD